MVRVEKAQLVPGSALAWAASDSGAARSTAQCASSTNAVSRTSRPEGRTLVAAESGWVMAWGMQTQGVGYEAGNKLAVSGSRPV